MALPDAGDVAKSVDRVRRFFTVTAALPGTWSASDYLGDSTADAGKKMPEGTLTSAHVNCQTVPDASSDLVVENETTGTTHTITVNAAYVEETGIDIYFSEGDELSVYFSSVGATVAGADGEVVVEFEIEPSPLK